MTETQQPQSQQQQPTPRQPRPRRRHRINVGDAERWTSVIAGGALVYWGIRRRTLPGLLTALMGGALIQRGRTGHCYMYGSLGLDTAHQQPREPEEYFDRGIHVEESFTINRSPGELYGFWRNFENLPQFMHHLQSVQVVDEKRSRWVAQGPAGTSVEWLAEIINDEPDRLIAWRSLAGAQVDNTGSVRFIDAGPRGTEVRVTVEYIPPAGRFGATIARLFGEAPDQQIHEDLRRFKRMMEAGEIPTAQGPPAVS